MNEHEHVYSEHRCSFVFVRTWTNTNTDFSKIIEHERTRTLVYFHPWWNEWKRRSSEVKPISSGLSSIKYKLKMENWPPKSPESKFSKKPMLLHIIFEFIRFWSGVSKIFSVLVEGDSIFLSFGTVQFWFADPWLNY